MVHPGTSSSVVQTMPLPCKSSLNIFITTFEIVLDGIMHIETLNSIVCAMLIRTFCRFDVNFSFTVSLHKFPLVYLCCFDFNILGLLIYYVL